MHDYLKWDEKNITDFDDKAINALYHEGYVFTRLGRGIMHQTRSVRIDLSKFSLSSENKRILRKTEHIVIEGEDIPHQNYSWEIGKMAKDFYDTKFGPGTFSANKIKELLTDPENSSFNLLSTFYDGTDKKCISYGDEEPYGKMLMQKLDATTLALGYAICYETFQFIHYSYPFYNLKKAPKSMGMGMMLREILSAVQWGKQYVYLGSAQRPGDTYKLQFTGLEWFDGKKWCDDLEELKTILE